LALDFADNGIVAMLEGLLVVGIIGLLVYLASRSLLSNQGQEPHPALTAGQWRTAHYDVDGHTRVVVQKVAPAGTHVLDEHVIAEIPVSEPDYDELFMTAMATARQRKAIFETEE
jgi:predicted lipid-binding transport protein (Tim44 family)